MLEKLGWLSINQLCCEVRLIEVWKALNQENHCLINMFEKAEGNFFYGNSEDRSNETLVLEFFSTTLFSARISEKKTDFFL